MGKHRALRVMTPRQATYSSRLEEFIHQKLCPAFLAQIFAGPKTPHAARSPTPYMVTKFPQRDSDESAPDQTKKKTMI